MLRLVAFVYFASVVLIATETISLQEPGQRSTKAGLSGSGKIANDAFTKNRDLQVFTESSPLFFLHLLKHKQKIQRIERIPTIPPAVDCICVPYYLCDINQTIITDGMGTIDVRFRRCTGDLEVCCYLRNGTSSMAPIITPTVTTPTTPQTTPTTPPTTPTTPPTTPTTPPTTPTTPPTTPTTPPTTPTTPPTTPTTPPTTPTTPPTTRPTTPPTTPTTPPTTPTPPPIIFPTDPTTQPTSGAICVCVPSSQCDPNGVIGNNGEGVINPRQQASFCPIIGQVCCRLSSVIPYPTNPPVTSPPIISPTLSPGQTQICFLCGNTIQCVTGIIAPSGTGMIDPRLMYSSLQLCPSNTCCQGANAVNENTASNVLGPLKNAGTSQACYCVKSWLCSEGNVISFDGIGAIDPRFTACPSADEVCCRPTGIDLQGLGQSARVPTGSGGQYIVNDDFLSSQVGCGIRNTSFAPAQPYPIDSGKTYFAEFPWMVALLTQQSNGQYLFQCGASMISNKAVLTAAHCVVNRDIGKLVARFGQWDLESRKQPAPIQEVIVKTIVAHPLFYSGGLFHDVALLILEQTVSHDININPICLPQQGMIFPAGTRCYGTGWGSNSFGTDGKYQAELRKVELPIIDRSECQTRLRSTRLGPFFQLHGSFICAGGESNRDTCRGDGGGPLACQLTTGQFVQAGIVSWGIGCGMSDVPAVYASVSQHRQWIDQQLATYGA